MDIDGEHERWTQDERQRGDIRARLRLLTAEESGRHTPVYSGYRSHWAFPPEVHDERHDAPLTLETSKVLELGEETIVRLHPPAPELWPAVQPGLQLTMLEGARVIGVAEVVEAVPPVD